MKVHQFSNELSSSSLSLSCKRLRPLAPKLSSGSPSSPPSSSSGVTSTTFDLKSFVRPDHNSTRKLKYPDTPQVETHQGGTRWNPTQEQIGILEMLYKGGMRTPNAQQIEHITSQLGNYGKIEGKNVFYWFQNHKARERQKQKRNNLFTLSCQTNFKNSTSTDHMRESVVEKEEIGYKRTCRSWGFENLEIETRSSTTATFATSFNKITHNVTLQLFPLHPEGR